MVCERRTQKNEIFNIPSNIDYDLMNNQVMDIEGLGINHFEWIEYHRIREERRREREENCRIYGITCDDAILLMTNEEWNELFWVYYVMKK